MKREQIEEYLRASRLICSAIYLRKSRAEEHMSLEETLSRHRAALIAYAEKYGYRVDPLTSMKRWCLERVCLPVRRCFA